MLIFVKDKASPTTGVFRTALRNVETLKHLFKLEVLPVKLGSKQSSQFFNLFVEDFYVIEESILGRRVYTLSFICGGGALRNEAGAASLSRFSTLDRRFSLGLCACLAFRHQFIRDTRTLGFPGRRGLSLFNIKRQARCLHDIGLAFRLLEWH
ncbi:MULTISPECIES: hypothetical protein [unclassified Sinorhizobium]|uniref:hypothetical protein n=1 Tax=unclassified Sinorhizobium TaxID=2613772 RepID=UPI002867C9AD|nr:hypothetical protein [Sinorhizobium sp. 8-89]